MRKLALITALAAAAFALDGAAAQQAQQQAQPQGAEDKQITGMVTAADEQTHKITINDQTYVMPEEGGGAAMFPQVGAEVTLFYREEGGEKLITRIGQKQE